MNKVEGKQYKEITTQIDILRQLFPGIGYADEKLAEQDLPPNAKGWFVIPRWEKIAPTYGEAVQKVLDLIKHRNGAFYNYIEGQLGPQHLCQSQKASKAFKKLGDEQKDYDILVVPAQFIFRHSSPSFRQAREIMNPSEFVLGAFAIGIMILTHPEWIQHYDNHWIVCFGDEFAPPDSGSDFSWSLYFKFFNDEVSFNTIWVDYANGFFGL